MAILTPHLPMVRTFAEWGENGYRVIQGQKATGKNAAGIATFTEDQVRFTGVIQRFNPPRPAPVVTFIPQENPTPPSVSDWLRANSTEAPTPPWRRAPQPPPEPSRTTAEDLEAIRRIMSAFDLDDDDLEEEGIRPKKKKEKKVKEVRDESSLGQGRNVQL